MVTTRSMTHRARYDAQRRRPHELNSSFTRPHRREPFAAGPSRPRCPALREVTRQACGNNESNLTKLRRTGISATPVDWLPDIIRFECGVVMERYEQYVSEIDDSVDLDRVRRASVLVKAQACTLATLFVPDIQQFLLPELEGTRQAVFEKWRDLYTAAGGISDTARAVEVMEEIDKVIMFFKNLIEDVADHCDIVI
jgi:hypothetical protein